MAVARFDAIVAGAGVVGLAVARVLAREGHDVVVLEAERGIGRHQSSRSSEVMHAGLYYAPGSLRARLCVRGRELLEALCEAEGIPHRRVGKLVVATSPEEVDVLQIIERTAHVNGVHDACLVHGDRVRALEPEVHAVAALHSPSTGIIDSDALLRVLRRQAEDHGATVVLGTRVRGVHLHEHDIAVVAGDATVRCAVFVNAAGVGAQAIARTVTPSMPPHTIPPLHLAKGSYFRVDARPFSRLIYPVPDTASLGIHATLDLQGGVRFGPDQEWVQTPGDHAVDPRRAGAFAAAVRRYWPALRDGALRPDYAGIRAKVQGPGDPPADFVVSGPREHGVPGLVNLFGIESPGLTACLALADEVLERIRR